MKKNLLTLAALLCCALTITMQTACTSDNDDNPVDPKAGVDSRIVGNWCSDVSGKTFAKWNYGETWQNTEFKADGTGTTHIYYTKDDDAIACEEITFSYTASADGKLTMTPTDREVMNAQWQVEGSELKLTDGNELSLSFKKATSDMTAKFVKWSKTENLIQVPRPAKFTVFVYGNAGGTMDKAIEKGFWEKAKEFLTDQNNVRVVCLYKYGKDNVDGQGNHDFTGVYAEPGDVVWFDLTSETDLNKIKEEGMRSLGLWREAIGLKVCEPKTLKMFMDFSSLVCPAEEYVFSIWGHGSGFNPMNDIPGKYDLARSTTRGVMYDEWNNDEELDMYELREAIKASGINRLNTIFFQNCMMGNLETLATINNCADYICCSSHVLRSDGEVLNEFVRGLIDKGNAEDAVAQMFERVTPGWVKGYYGDATATNYANGDYKMYRTDRFDGILEAVKHLADRLVELYPTQKEAINRATIKVYRYVEYMALYIYPFFDVADYAHLLERETGDAQMKTIANELDQAIKEAFIHYRDVSWCKEHLDHYTLSVCLVNDKVYNYTNYKEEVNPSYLCNFSEGYEQCDFHKFTGWGNWLRINEQALNHNPQNNGGGRIE